MSSASPEGSLDEREASLAQHVDSCTIMADTALESDPRGIPHAMLSTLQDLRPEAKSLADAGRPAQSEHLEREIARLSARLEVIDRADRTRWLLSGEADLSDPEVRAEYDELMKNVRAEDPDPFL